MAAVALMRFPSTKRCTPGAASIVPDEDVLTASDSLCVAVEACVVAAVCASVDAPVDADVDASVMEAFHGWGSGRAALAAGASLGASAKYERATPARRIASDAPMAMPTTEPSRRRGRSAAMRTVDSSRERGGPTMTDGLGCRIERHGGNRRSFQAGTHDFDGGNVDGNLADERRHLEDVDGRDLLRGVGRGLAGRPLQRLVCIRHVHRVPPFEVDFPTMRIVP